MSEPSLTAKRAYLRILELMARADDLVLEAETDLILRAARDLNTFVAVDDDRESLPELADEVQPALLRVQLMRDLRRLAAIDNGVQTPEELAMLQFFAARWELPLTVGTSEPLHRSLDALQAYVGERAEKKTRLRVALREGTRLALEPEELCLILDSPLPHPFAQASIDWVRTDTILTRDRSCSLIAIVYGLIFFLGAMVAVPDPALERSLTALFFLIGGAALVVGVGLPLREMRRTASTNPDRLEVVPGVVSAIQLLSRRDSRHGDPRVSATASYKRGESVYAVEIPAETATRLGQRVWLQVDRERHTATPHWVSAHALPSRAGAEPPKATPPRGPTPKVAGTVSVSVQAQQQCPFCRDTLPPDPVQLLTCNGCRVVFHRECIEEAGSCTTLACRNNRRTRREQA